MTDPRRCKGCYYWRAVSRNHGGIRCCHHLLATGKRRMVEDEVCRSRKAGEWRGGPTLLFPAAAELTCEGCKGYRRPV